jgi:hypothetical protein
MSKPRLNSYEDFLNNNTYGAIIKILQFAPEHNRIFSKGLKTGELRDLIVKGYSLKKGRVQVLRDLRKFLEENHPDIKLDQSVCQRSHYQGFNKYLKTLKNPDNQFIIKKKDCWTLTKKYQYALLKNWHSNMISECKLDNVIPLPKIVFYFPNGSIKLYDPEVTRDDIRKLDEISKNIDEKFGEIQDVFLEIGKRKGVRIAFQIINNLKCDDSMKLLIACHIIFDLSSLEISNKILLPKKETYTGLELLQYTFKSHQWEEKLWNEILKYAVVELIGKEDKKTKKELEGLLDKYENEQYNGITYSMIHGFLLILIHEAMSNSRYFIPLCEQPSLFLANQGIGFKENEIILLKKAKTLKDFYEATEKLKKLTHERIAPIDIEHDIQEKIGAQDYIFKEFYRDFFDDQKRDKILYYLKEIDKSFRESKFLDGFEEKIKAFDITKDIIYDEMDKWGTIFSAINTI